MWPKDTLSVNSYWVPIWPTSFIYLQFVYCCLVGTFPFNAFLSGFISCVASFVLGVCLRLQVSEQFKFLPTEVRSYQVTPLTFFLLGLCSMVDQFQYMLTEVRWWKVMLSTFSETLPLFYGRSVQNFANRGQVVSGNSAHMCLRPCFCSLVNYVPIFASRGQIVSENSAHIYLRLSLIKCFGYLTFWYVSGCGSRSSDSYFWLTYPGGPKTYGSESATSLFSTVDQFQCLPTDVRLCQLILITFIWDSGTGSGSATLLVMYARSNLKFSWVPVPYRILLLYVRPSYGSIISCTCILIHF